MPAKKFVIVGAALSANKGAAAMAESVVEHLHEYVGPAEFTLLTTYPKDDATKTRDMRAVEVLGLEPLRLACVEFPIALLAALSRALRIPRGWVRTRGCRAILDADCVIDVAGISFVDGRGIPITVYNALMTAVPLLLGTPTVKAAQAMGPFRKQPNRTLAKLILPHLAAICARGAGTREHLDELKMNNVHNVADLAFTLPTAKVLPVSIEERIAHCKNEYVLVMPSSVVKGLYQKQGGNYVDAMVELIKEIRRATGRTVVVAPHSLRVGKPEGRMNDGPVCDEIIARLQDDSEVIGIRDDLYSAELRRLVADSRMLVTSRFHAMISGLATATPTIVLGWSHKYREVLDLFGASEYGLDAMALSDTTRVVDLVTDALNRHDELSEQIKHSLPAVIQQSEENFRIIASVLH
jgi:polysaccharide pyruvyl transferase WcaK-like protein